jgi:hypothetical protein
MQSPLKRITEGIKDAMSSKTDNIWKLFTNAIFLPVPKVSVNLDSILRESSDNRRNKGITPVIFLSFQEEEILRAFNSQIEEDKKIIVSRHNLIELHKVG